jgi:hypothetical protein
MIGRANRVNRGIQVPPIHARSDQSPLSEDPGELPDDPFSERSRCRDSLRSGIPQPPGDPFGAGFDVSCVRAERGHTQDLAGVATVDRRRRAGLGTDEKGCRPPRPAPQLIGR